MLTHCHTPIVREFPLQALEHGGRDDAPAEVLRHPSPSEPVVRGEVVLQTPLRLYRRLLYLRSEVKVGRALGLVPPVRRVQVQVILRVVENLKDGRECEKC